jgi:hypothetical protein
VDTRFANPVSDQVTFILLTLDTELKCPDDDIPYTKIEELPKNISLIKLLNNKRLSISQLEHGDQTYICNTPKEKKFNYKISTEDLSYGLNNTVGTINITNNNYNTINITTPSSSSSMNLRSSIRKGTKDNFTYNHVHKMCQKHNRPVEVICIDDKEKICANCALFGEHKTHTIINEEDFFKEISLKAEILIDLYELIDFNINTFDMSTDSSCEDKFSELRKRAENFFGDIYEKLRKREKEVLDEINKKKEEVMKNSLQTIPQPLLHRAEDWKSVVQTKLDRLGEFNDNEKEELSLLIENNNVNQDLISSAESIVDEFSKVKTTHMEKYINTYTLDIDKRKVNEFLSASYIKLVDDNHVIDNLLLLNEEGPPIDSRFSIQMNPLSAKKETVQMSINEESPLTKQGGGTVNASSTSILNLSQDSALTNSKQLLTI